MLLNQDVRFLIYKIDNDTFEQLYELDNVKSLIWPTSFYGYSSFEMWAPPTDENLEYLVPGNFIWKYGTTQAVKIESFEKQKDEDGVVLIDIKGRTLEYLLTKRIVWGTYSSTSSAVSTMMYGLVDTQCINPSKTARAIPYLVNATDAAEGDVVDTYQQTGGDVYDAVDDLAENYSVGYRMELNPENQTITFVATTGTDYSENNSDGNDPIVISTDMEDILESDYYKSIQDVRNVALVGGEGDGADRTFITTGDDTLTGFERMELFVNASDIQSESTDDDGNTVTLTTDEYDEALTERGDEYLDEYTVSETFDVTVRTINPTYEYGVDYMLGDTITVIDEDLGIKGTGQITASEEDYSTEYSLILTVGFSSLSLMKKVRRLIRAKK